MNKKVIITGKSGFIASNLSERLERDGYDVYDFNRHSQIQDIISINPSYIFHCAAQIKNNNSMFVDNVMLTYNILSCLNKLKELKSLVYLGSSSEYGKHLTPTKETDYLNIETLYSATKASCTHLCQAFAKEFNLPIQIARLYSIYGPGEKQNRLIPTIYNSWKNKEVLKIYPGAHDFCFVEDLIDGLILLSEKSDKYGEIFNFSNGINTTNLEVVQIFEKIIGGEITKSFVLDKLNIYDSNYWAGDSTKAELELGWEPKYTLEQGLTEYIKYRENARN